jgi:predicted methyltransferase
MIGVLGALVLLCAGGAAGAQPGAAINAQYKDPNLVVEVWVDRLESEGREAYDFRAQIADAIGLRPGQAVADVGAGTGLYTRLLAARVGAEGKSSEFTLEHIRAGKEVFTAEIEANGFRFTGEPRIDGMEETFIRHFERR